MKNTPLGAQKPWISMIPRKMYSEMIKNVFMGYCGIPCKVVKRIPTYHFRRPYQFCRPLYHFPKFWTPPYHFLRPPTTFVYAPTIFPDFGPLPFLPKGALNYKGFEVDLKKEFPIFSYIRKRGWGRWGRIFNWGRGAFLTDKIKINLECTKLDQRHIISIRFIFWW